jgi:hypothetical protein
MDDDKTTRPGRRPSAMAMLAAGTLGAAVLGIGGAAYAQSAEPADPDAAVTQEQECDDKAGRGDAGADSTQQAPTEDTTSADA